MSGASHTALQALAGIAVQHASPAPAEGSWHLLLLAWLIPPSTTKRPNRRP